MSKPREIIEKTQIFLKEYEAKNKKIDIIVENAGLSMRSRFHEYDFENH